MFSKLTLLAVLAAAANAVPLLHGHAVSTQNIERHDIAHHHGHHGLYDGHHGLQGGLWNGLGHGYAFGYGHHDTYVSQFIVLKDMFSRAR